MSTSTPPASDEAARSAFEARFAQARRLILSGNTIAARRINDELLAEQPGDCGALIQRSRLESTDDHYRSARDYALSAFRAGARTKRQCMLLLRRLRTFNLIAEFRQLAANLPVGLEGDPDLAILVSNLYESINEPQSALAVASKAAAGEPS